MALNMLTGDLDPISLLDEIQVDPYKHLDMPQQMYAEAAISAMVDVLGVNGEDIRLIVEGDRGSSRRLVLIDGSPNGLHYGNYGKILKLREVDSSVLNIEIDEKQIDVLSGTTYSVYWGMICEAIHRGVVAPDSVALSHQNDLPWTATMLTGEPLTDEGLILVASVSSGAVSYVGFKPNRGGTSMRVRPTVLIPKPEEL